MCDKTFRYQLRYSQPGRPPWTRALAQSHTWLTAQRVAARIMREARGAVLVHVELAPEGE